MSAGGEHGDEAQVSARTECLAIGTNRRTKLSIMVALGAHNHGFPDAFVELIETFLVDRKEVWIQRVHGFWIGQLEGQYAIAEVDQSCRVGLVHDLVFRLVGQD